MNRVQLVGRLGHAPLMSQSAHGPVANFSIATNETWTDRETGAKSEHTEWHQVVCFDRNAEIAGTYLAKGSQVMVEGRLRATQWTDKDGREQKGVQLRIDNMQMLGRPPNTDAIASAARGMEFVETSLRDVAEGKTGEASLVELADMLDVLRWKLMGQPET